MKKIFKKLLTLILCSCILFSSVGCGGLFADPNEPITPNDPDTPDTPITPDATLPELPPLPDKTYTAEEIINEIAYAYDRQGAQIPYDQLNSRRSLYSSPEDATAERTIFLDCSSFVNSCYREAYGANVLPYEIRSKSASTLTYDEYARDNPNNPDVIGYWRPADYTTDAERAAVVEDIYEAIEVGDVLTYRHGTASKTKGHTYIYLGNKTFMHCAGAGSYVVNSANPALSYDSNSSEIAKNGTIETIDADTIFKNTTHTRYLFKKTSSDTVFSFGLIRPLARGLEPTDEMIYRMAIAGLSMEKTASLCENNTLDTGSLLTYTVRLDNTGVGALSQVVISDIVPNGTTFVSGDAGVTVKDGRINWVGDVGAKATVTVSYTVRVDANTPGMRIISDSTYVSGVKLGRIVHTVSGYTASQRALLAEVALGYAASSKKFSDSLDMISAAYGALGASLLEKTSVGDVLDQLIDEENLTAHTKTELAALLVPNLYGGLGIKLGWAYLPAENDKTRLPSESHLAVGDVILADWSGGSVAYLYVGNSTLLTVKGGVASTLTIEEDIYTAGKNIIISLLGYDRYAVIRPTVSSDIPDLDVSRLEITEKPAKLEYKNGESFDPAGMTVTALLTDGSEMTVSGYTVDRTRIASGMSSVTVSFGGASASLAISVTDAEYIKSVGDALKLTLGEKVTVEGIVIGVAHEGLNNDAEMLVKDINDDSVIAVRGIPYGEFPDFGYDRGDRIVFSATVKKDTSSSTNYTLKKYLEFSADNGRIENTIISKNNEITYELDDVLTLSSWSDMKSYFVKNKVTPYTYMKITAGSYLYYYPSNDTLMYRVHKNPSAADVDGMSVGDLRIGIRDDVMTANLGADWTKPLFDEVSEGYPGILVDKDFYVLFIGGNKSYYQLVILDESWILDK